MILFAQEIATQCLRPGDIAAASSDGIVACLPEAERSTAEQVARDIERAIGSTVKPAPSIAFQIHTGKEMETLIGTLR
jgi:hypothetical protein